jgi:hypothetical protein
VAVHARSAHWGVAVQGWAQLASSLEHTIRRYWHLCKYRISLQSWQRLLYLKIKPGILHDQQIKAQLRHHDRRMPSFVLCQGAGSNSFSSFCLVAITFENSAMTSLPFMSFALISEGPGRITNKALRMTAV